MRFNGRKQSPLASNVVYNATIYITTYTNNVWEILVNNYRKLSLGTAGYQLDEGVCHTSTKLHQHLRSLRVYFNIPPRDCQHNYNNLEESW